MYVEYLGIPGCGKTFWKEIFLEDLRREGVSYLDVSRQKVMPLWLKVFYKLAEIVLLQLPKYKKLTREYRNAIKNCSIVPRYLPFSLTYCIKDIVLASLLHDFFRGKRIYINDEGQLQRIVFLSIQYDVPFKDLFPLYMKYRGDVKTIYVQTPIETAMANIRKRNRHVCPMDELAEEELIKYGKAFFESCEKIAQEINDNFVVKKI